LLETIRESQPAKSAGGGGDRGGDGELKRASSSSSSSSSVGADDGGAAGGGTQVQRQPCPLDFDLKEIEGFRYRVEDGT
jgi:hypothetical protein